MAGSTAYPGRYSLGNAIFVYNLMGAVHVHNNTRREHTMMVAKILRKDFLRKKIITIVVFAFILLSAFLVASGSNLIME